jgi:hypothetical protein
MYVVVIQLRDVAVVELQLEIREKLFFTHRSFHSLAEASAHHVKASPIRVRGSGWLITNFTNIDSSSFLLNSSPKFFSSYTSDS